MISRATDGFEGVFLEVLRDNVDRLGRDVRGFEMRDPTDAAVVGSCSEVAAVAACCVTFSLAGRGFTYADTGKFTHVSGGSEDGGSEPILGLKGVRKGDLNGFWSVFVASFNRRRLACGVDIFAVSVTLVATRTDCACRKAE